MAAMAAMAARKKFCQLLLQRNSATCCTVIKQAPSDKSS
jgi:hypothetical protein